MRLAPFLLIPLAGHLMAQGGKLPWSNAEGLPWESLLQFQAVPEIRPPLPTRPPTGTVTWDQDGTFHVNDERGVKLLRFGIPGRPTKIWQDDGVAVNPAQGRWQYPLRTPLDRGFGGLPLGQQDFRPALQGLLWILDDGERTLTLLNASTCRLLYLPLPGQTSLDLAFFPDRLEIRQTGLGGHPTMGWSLPWISLLPQFILLGKPMEKPKPGTAMAPFPSR